MVAAGLRQIPASNDAELNAQMLKEDCHEIGDHDNRQQRIPKLSAARQIRRPIAWVHVADGDQKTGAGKREQLSPKGSGYGNDDAAMDFRQRNGCDVSAPGLFGCGQFRYEMTVINICLRASTKVRAGLAG